MIFRKKRFPKFGSIAGHFLHERGNDQRGGERKSEKRKNIERVLIKNQALFSLSI